MKFSGWNQYWEHSETVSQPPEKIFSLLLEHYKQSSKSFNLDKEVFPNALSFHRGNALMSALGLGSELWCLHYVDVSIDDAGNGETNVSWRINLKLFGFQAGTNAIIQECKKIIASVA